VYSARSGLEGGVRTGGFATSGSTRGASRSGSCARGTTGASISGRAKGPIIGGGAGGSFGEGSLAANLGGAPAWVSSSPGRTGAIGENDAPTALSGTPNATRGRTCATAANGRRAGVAAGASVGSGARGAGGRGGKGSVAFASSVPNGRNKVSPASSDAGCGPEGRARGDSAHGLWTKGMASCDGTSPGAIVTVGSLVPASPVAGVAPPGAGLVGRTSVSTAALEPAGQPTPSSRTSIRPASSA
jgi:hypothetical protein